MRAMRAEGFSGYKDLKLMDIPKPAVSDGRVLVNITAADILRIENGLLVEYWDVIQGEATEEQSKSGAPMFGENFPNHK
jgi:predicted SnoaL-like aldol condensation-catalyzing enzyme